MKKLWTLGVVIMLALALTACGHGGEPEETETEETAAETAVTEEEPAAEEAAELPAELVGSWMLETDPAASLEIAADGAVSFFISGRGDGAGQIVMEDGKAVAHTASYLEGVEKSFTLTPDKDGDGPRVAMSFTDPAGETLLWVPATAAAAPEQAAATARVDQELLDCLVNVGQRVQVGSSSAHMSAVAQAAALMDWAAASAMSPAEVHSAFAAHFNTLDNNGKAAYLLQMELVDGAYQELLREGQEALLADAGVSGSGYPWDYRDMEPLEALMTAAGLR
ncbi:MAG: hypothetical protein IK116_03470 [Firmicutes bacterium]|nr:hypothetical protein [Bacillota bacterium]